MLKIIAAFLSSMVAGNATFFVTINGKKYSVNLTKNGMGQAPNFSAIVQLAMAVMSLSVSGEASAEVRIGANVWTVAVAAA